MQLAPFLAYLTHKLSFLVHSYLPALAAQCEHVVLPGPLGPGFVALLHRFNERFLPEACPEEGQHCARSAAISPSWVTDLEVLAVC